jgi:hypothetical protein
MSHFIELAKTQEETQKNILLAIKEFEKGNLQNQAKAGKIYAMQVEALKGAMTIAGDCIYEKTIENKALRSAIGEVDEEWIRERTELTKKNDTIDDKNKTILEELKRTMSKTKAIKQ